MSKLFILPVAILALLMQVWTPSPTGPTPDNSGGGGAIVTTEVCSSSFAGSTTAACTGTVPAGTKGIICITGIGDTGTTVTSCSDGHNTFSACGFSKNSFETVDFHTLTTITTGSQTFTSTIDMNKGVVLRVVALTNGTGTFGYCAADTHGGSTPAILSAFSSATGHVVVNGMIEDMGGCSLPNPVNTTRLGSDSCTGGQWLLAMGYTAGAATVSPEWDLTDSGQWGMQGVDYQ